jgi:arylsulfatase A-like enzyme
MDSRPNILLILTDQQTWSAIGDSTNPHLRTPHLDRLRGQSASFPRCYCASPVCGPSRMSLATSRPPHEHGFTHHFQKLWDWDAHGLVSFGEHLHKAGYDARWIGKWHASRFIPRAVDDAEGFTNMTGFGPERERLGLDMDGLWAGQAADFLDSRPQGPFFLGVSLHNPHDICYWIMGTDEDVNARFSPPPGAELPPLPENFCRSPDEPAVMRLRRDETQYGPELAWTKDWDETDWRRYLYAYNRLVEHIDTEIGRVLDALDRSGLADNTLVVFTSDHGESCAGHELVVKLSCYDEAMRVPLFLRWPGHIEPGSELDFPVSGLDVAPTVLDAAGAEPLSEGRGVSLLPVLRGEAEPDRAVVSELYPTMQRLEAQARIVCRDHWKYILSWDGEQADETLYDLDRDPGEQHNLAADSGQVSVLEDLRHDYAAWCETTHDPLPELMGAASPVS